MDKGIGFLKLHKKVLFVIVIFSILLFRFVARAWTPPSSSPPNNNTPAPINTGDSSQTKSGSLSVSGLLTGSTVSGPKVNASTSICIAGDCKTAWNQIGASQWTTSSTSIYYNGGNVGIGTAIPGRILEVEGGIALGNASSASRGIYWDTAGQADAGGGKIERDNSTGNLIIQSQANQKVLLQPTSGNVGIATSTPAYPLTLYASSADSAFGIFRAGATNPTLFKMGTDGALVINNSSTDVLAIKNGMVGVGTTSPQNVLDVAKTATTTYNPNAYNSGQNLRITFGDADQSYGLIRFASNGQMENSFGVVQQGASAQGDFVWQTYSGTAYGERMRLTRTGNLGIGTTSPGAKLQLNTSSNTDGIYLFRTGGNNQALLLSGDTTSGAYVAGGTTPAGNDSGNGDGVGRLILQNGPAEGFQFQTSQVAANAAANWATRMVIKNNGNVGIGTTAPSAGRGGAAKLEIKSNDGGMVLNGTAGSYSGMITWQNNGSQLWSMWGSTGDSRWAMTDADTSAGVMIGQNETSWSAWSDRRLKKDIKTFSVLDRLSNYRAVSFDWLASGRHDLGVVAQEIYPIFPEIVGRGSDGELSSARVDQPGLWTVMYDKFGPIALQGVKELDQQVKELEKKNELLQKENDSIRARLDVLEAKIK